MKLLEPLLLWLPVPFFLMLGAWAVKSHLNKKRRCTVDDVPLMLRRADLPLLEELLDADEEAALRKEHSAAAFRAMQRKRIAAAREHLRRIDHNASVFLKWGYTEEQITLLKNPAVFTDHDLRARELLRFATEVKSDVAAKIIKIELWRIVMLERWFFLPSPSLSDLRERRGVDILQSYEALISTAGDLSLSYGPEKYQRLMRSL